MSLLARAVSYLTKGIGASYQTVSDGTNYGTKKPGRVLEQVAETLGVNPPPQLHQGHTFTQTHLATLQGPQVTPVEFYQDGKQTYLIVPTDLLIDPLNTVGLIPLPEDFSHEKDAVSVKRLFNPKAEEYSTPPDVDFFVGREGALDEAMKILDSMKDGSPEREQFVRDSRIILQDLHEHHPETVRHSVRVHLFSTFFAKK